MPHGAWLQLTEIITQLDYVGLESLFEMHHKLSPAVVQHVTVPAYMCRSKNKIIHHLTIEELVSSSKLF
jgi:hypothetical protein